MAKRKPPRLRDYQALARRTLPRLLARYGRVVAVAPTGSGKTVIGAAVVRAMRGKRVLWLAHRIELLQQAYDELIRFGVPEKDIGIYAGDKKENTTARVLVASVSMFRSGTVPRADLIVVDEAHHVAAKSYRAILDARPRARVLGLTATPQRLDGEPLGDVFSHLYVAAEPETLVVDRHLVPVVVYGVPREKAAELVKSAGAGKEYTAKRLEKAMKKRPLMADIVKERARLAPGQPTIVYACTRAHGRSLEKRFKAAGVTTGYVDGDTPAREREALLGKRGLFARGVVEVVVNVGVLTEGFDCPPASCIVVARPTKSLMLWRQMCGRGARPFKGKRRNLILDHAGNVWRHGFPDSQIEWSLDGHPKKTGDAPLKLCPECQAVILASARECSGCGTEQPRSERELAEQRAELEIVTIGRAERAALRERLARMAKKRRLPESWVDQTLARVENAA